MGQRVSNRMRTKVRAEVALWALILQTRHARRDLLYAVCPHRPVHFDRADLVARDLQPDLLHQLFAEQALRVYTERPAIV